MGPCIIMMQHEVMVVDEWHNNGPQDLIAPRLSLVSPKVFLSILSLMEFCFLAAVTSGLLSFADK